ncbi:MAG: hypothetical protein Q4D42_11010 [Eubacteriales bacterium]|nr:hypothetical protein [Eubacteriales bacterium]
MKKTTRRRIAAFALTATLSTTTLSGMVLPASAASVATLASTSTSKPATPSGVKVSISYPSNRKATAKVSWNNVSGASGYQIMTGGNSSMTVDDATYTTTGSSKSISYTRGKKAFTRYFKVRVYKTVNGKKIYGGWSAVKSVSVAKKR